MNKASLLEQFENFYQESSMQTIMQLFRLPCSSWNTAANRRFSCDGKQILSPYDIWKQCTNNQAPAIKFNPLCKKEKSCSYLVMNDSVHMYCNKFVRYIFNNLNIENDKENTNVASETSKMKLKINTKSKFLNLLDFANATLFSKNLISFEIDSANSQKNVKVTFEYPLFDMINTTQTNTIFGIFFEDYEINLFIRIYEEYIIAKINTLFRDAVAIPKQSSNYPYLYVLLKIRIEINNIIINKENSEYKEILSNLNKFDAKNIDDCYTKDDIELDEEAYKNELQIRKESESNWNLLYEDNEMKKNKQPAVIKDNNIGQIIDRFGNFLGTYDVKRYTNVINKLNTDRLVQDYKDNYQILKNDKEWKDIFYLQNLVLDVLQTEGGDLWYDSRIKKYCFRSKLNGSIREVDSNELGDLLTRAFKEKIIHYNSYSPHNLLNYAMEIVLVSKLKGINNQKLSVNEKSNDIIKILLFENEIKTVDDDAFNVETDNEIFKEPNDFFYTQNRFIPNKYLAKRYQQNRTVISHNAEQTFIEKFIYYLAKEDQELSDYIVNWLAYYFQNLQKSGIALVLLGDQYITQGIFWNLIVKEIFDKRYGITINDKECESSLIPEIAKDKLFFHIGNIDDADSEFDDKTLAFIVKELLIRETVTDNDNEEIPIYGQMLITAKNPAPYTKKILSKCTVVEVNDFNTIIKKLGLQDEGEFEPMIAKDLDTFTNRLLNYSVDENTAKSRLDTEARELLKDNHSTNIDGDEVDKNIELFIQAIKDKNLEYFERVKELENGEIYAHLKSAFDKDDGYWIRQDLYKYYNAIHKEQFKNNKIFMDRLKEKDDMFKQEVDVLKIIDKEGKEQILFQPYQTLKEGNKKLSKIKDYKLASDITIPDGATIISSQTNLKKYHFGSDEELEACIKRTEQYRKNKKNNSV